MEVGIWDEGYMFIYQYVSKPSCTVCPLRVAHHSSDELRGLIF